MEACIGIIVFLSCLLSYGLGFKSGMKDSKFISDYWHEDSKFWMEQFFKATQITENGKHNKKPKKKGGDVK